MNLRRFLSYYLILIIVSALIYYLLGHFITSVPILIPHFWIVFIFMASITLLVYFLSILGIKKGGDYQSFIILGGVVIRLLASMTMALIYIINIKVSSILFITNFFSIYLLFTVFEIYCLLCNLRHQIKK